MNKYLFIPFISFLFFFVVCADVFAERSETSRLIFVGTADLQGKLDPVQRSVNLGNDGAPIQVVGGIARIASTVKKIKNEEEAPVIAISAGDDLMGRYFHFFDGKTIVELMGKAGYDILGLGNHEFDRGPGILGEALEKTDFTTLCSDLAVAGTALENSCKPYLIKKYGSVQVGFFSLMTEEFPFVTSGGNIRLQADNLTVARNMVALLKKQGADIIVAVTHVGVAQDRNLAAKVDGINIIFGGHSHDYLLDYEQVGETLIVNGGEKGPALVYLDVTLAQDKTIIKDSIRFRLIPITEDIEEDRELKKRLTSYQAKMPEAIVLGKTETTWDLSKAAVRSGESSVADLVNDLVRDKFPVDIVLNNSGAFRGNKEYPPGPVTNTMLHEIDEFENDVYLLKIQGRYIKEILEHSASRLGSGAFLQVSGLRFTINLSGTAQIITEQDGKWTITKPGGRVADIQVAGENGAYYPLDPEKEYSVACNAFLAERSGDKYFWFKKFGINQKNTYTTLYSILAEEFDKRKILTPPQPDGRITVKK